jgi:formylmethanofuran dehydrogenase subunit E
MGKCIRMNDERIPKKVLNMTLKGKCQKRQRYKQELKIRTDVIQKEEYGWIFSMEDRDRWRWKCLRKR